MVVKATLTEHNHLPFRVITLLVTFTSHDFTGCRQADADPIFGWISAERHLQAFRTFVI